MTQTGDSSTRRTPSNAKASKFSTPGALAERTPAGLTGEGAGLP